MHVRSAILCIDDREIELSLRKMVLENAGYAVLTAANAAQGLKTFNAHQIDLVITEHFESGPEIAFVAELRKLNPRLPIIILSGGKTPGRQMNPPDYFLHKLEGPTKMIATVQSAIRRWGTKPTRFSPLVSSSTKKSDLR
jgi:DNA-binding NtrC family response regulator